MALDKAAILAANDSNSIEVQVPEWGGSVFVRTMSGMERDQWEEQCRSTKRRDGEMSMENFRARLLVRVLAGADGKRLFTDTDFMQLGFKSSVALDRLFAVAKKHNGLDPADVDELRKNSETTTGDGSSTDTPAS